MFCATGYRNDKKYGAESRQDRPRRFEICLLYSFAAALLRRFTPQEHEK